MAETPLRCASSGAPLTTIMRMEKRKKSLTKKCARRSPVCGLEGATDAFKSKKMLRSNGTPVRRLMTVAARRRPVRGVCKTSGREHHFSYKEKVILRKARRAVGWDLPRNGVRKVEIPLKFEGLQTRPPRVPLHPRIVNHSAPLSCCLQSLHNAPYSAQPFV